MPQRVAQRAAAASADAPLGVPAPVAADADTGCEAAFDGAGAEAGVPVLPHPDRATARAAVSIAARTPRLTNLRGTAMTDSFDGIRAQQTPHRFGRLTWVSCAGY